MSSNSQLAGGRRFLPTQPPSFSWPLRVYWEDTDAGGVVYHARYLHFLERARTEWLRSFGVSQVAWKAEADRVFALRDLQIEFIRPARLDDALRVSVRVDELRGASLSFVQDIVRETDGATLVRASVRAACLRASDFRPAPIPAVMVEQMRASGACSE